MMMGEHAKHAGGASPRHGSGPCGPECPPSTWAQNKPENAATKLTAEAWGPTIFIDGICDAMGPKTPESTPRKCHNKLAAIYCAVAHEPPCPPTDHSRHIVPGDPAAAGCLRKISRAAGAASGRQRLGVPQLTRGSPPANHKLVSKPTATDRHGDGYRALQSLALRALPPSQ